MKATLLTQPSRLLVDRYTADGNIKNNSRVGGNIGAVESEVDEMRNKLQKYYNWMLPAIS